MTKAPLGDWTTRSWSHFKSPTRLYFRGPADLLTQDSFLEAISESFFGGGSFQKLPSSSSVEVRFGYRPEIDGICFTKRFFLRDTWDKVKHLLRSSRGVRAHTGGLLLQANGFLTPKSLCAIEERCYRQVLSSGLVMEAIVGGRSLLSLLHDRSLDTSQFPASESHRIAGALGREIGRMHRVGIFHGDMNAGNIFVCTTLDTVTFVWLDNERVRKYSVVPRKLRLKNLRQLNKIGLTVSRSDRLRVWQAYRRELGLTSLQSTKELTILSKLTEAYWNRFGKFAG